jgi:hypothetical protein
MAHIDVRANIAATVTICLSESEAAALDALAGYGADAFLAVFYEKLGKAYMQPHEAGLRSLFSSVHGGACSVESVLRRARGARAVFEGSKVAAEAE